MYVRSCVLACVWALAFAICSRVNVFAKSNIISVYQTSFSESATNMLHLRVCVKVENEIYKLPELECVGVCVCQDRSND